MSFGRFLGVAIGVAGYPSNAAFARAAGVPTSSVSKWRNNIERPTPEALRKLAPILNTPILELMVWAEMLSWREAGLPGPLSLPVPPDIDAIISKITESPMSEEAKRQVIVELRRLATPKAPEEAIALGSDGENVRGRSA